jgi:hypothetical protein
LKGLSRIFLILALAACAAMPTTYHPQASLNGDGYRDAPIESDRYRVDFRGNIDTPRSLVEEYLLYNAAEVTVNSGHDFFYVVNSNTDTRTRYDGYVDPDFGGGAFGGYGYPGWYGGASFSETANNSYDATATILVGTGKRPNDPNAYDAHDVLKTLGPQVVRPALNVQ